MSKCVFCVCSCSRPQREAPGPEEEEEAGAEEASPDRVQTEPRPSPDRPDLRPAQSSALTTTDLKMRLWIVLLVCVASQALAAPMEEELIMEEPVPEEAAPEEVLLEEPEVGVNPVQVEVGEFDEAIDPEEETLEEVLQSDPCLSHHCKKGKVCELDDANTPMCVCQDPSSCAPAEAEFEHVCGTDNKTYDTLCNFFATKCTLEGTKKGHKLHLDYIGPCKYIEACVDTELKEFPLRMRDWLKNVLVTLYERDEENNLLTEKQKLRVKKIYDNEKRLQAGDHSLDLLAHDFEKNYNMFIFPVHWQFGQLDQHPSDGVAAALGLKDQDVDKDLIV
uniref:Kazal-like domain-containing protein n=1 Tax=Knipowitschia caucasica TaxID=637954 RepID=A0AAV2MLZ8_KNICA